MDTKKTIVTILREDAPNSTLVLSEEVLKRMINVTGLKEHEILLGLDTLQRCGVIECDDELVH